jgi:hypothetical protein
MDHPTQNPSESTAPRHEMSDAAPWPVLIFIVSLVATLMLVHLAGWGALQFLQRGAETDNREVFPVHPLAGTMRSNPPGPLLEPEPSRDVLPRVDLLEVREREQSLIGEHAWGWADSSHQFARIPVDQAINLAVEHGLPEVLPATQPSARPSALPASTLHGPGGVP